MKVTHGFVSFTEVEAGAHHSYNEWHVFDHMPEQFPLPGIVFGQRWVLPPSLRPFMHATEPLDRIHYVTLYLMAEPIDATLRDFRGLAVELRDKNRFHTQRVSHLSGALALTDLVASPRALVSAEAVPYRPNRGVHVTLTRGPVDTPPEHPGVAGAWVFRGDDGAGAPELSNTVAIWRWIDGDPAEVGASLPADPSAYFSASFETVDPWSAWDWFDTA